MLRMQCTECNAIHRVQSIACNMLRAIAACRNLAIFYSFPLWERYNILKNYLILPIKRFQRLSDFKSMSITVLLKKNRGS